jgi:hypothetical protein
LPLLAVLVTPASASAAPWGFSRGPTDQLGVSGGSSGVEITPNGGLYTGWAELGFRYGPRLAPWTGKARTPGAGGLPVYTALKTAGGVRYRVTQFASRVAGTPVAWAVVDVRNPTRRALRARWGSGVRWTGGERYKNRVWAYRFNRPATASDPFLYEQPGEGFSARARYTTTSRSVLRDGRVLVVASPGATRRASGSAATPTAEAGRFAWELRLKPRQTRRLVFRVPFTPLAPSAIGPVRAASPSAARAAVERRWRGILASTAQIRVPEPKAQRTWRSSLVNMLTARSIRRGDVMQAVNLLNYHAFWLRDGAMFAHAYELAGLEPEAKQILGFFARAQISGGPNDGLFISRPEQYDGFGQALWAYAEYVRRTGDAGYAKAVLPRVARAMAWLERARAADSMRLLPRANTYDNELVNGHLTGDDIWALAGARGAASLATAAGRPDLAKSYTAQAGDLQRTLLAAIRAAAKRHGGAIPPALDATGGNDWGNLWAAWPAGPLSSTDPAVTATLAKVRRSFLQGIASYAGGKVLHGYLGFRVFETELLRGEQDRVVRGLFAELAHTTSTDGGFEFNAPDNLTPHGWWAAEYVALLRNMLVREQGASDVRLLSAVPAQWLRPGRRISITGAPTKRGRVSLWVRGVKGGARVVWRTRLQAGTRLLLTVPGQGRRAVTLHGARGSRTVRWRDPKVVATWTGTVRALRRELGR